MLAQNAAAPTSARHSKAEDLLAIVCGNLLISLGLAMFTHQGFVPGGMAGIAILLHYASDLGFGPIFFLLNLPFYALSWWRMGAAFTLKTVAAVACLSALSHYTMGAMRYAELQPLYTALAGGLVIGTGFLVLFRHRASLGGIGILAAFLQDKHGWRAGHVQMAVDLGVLVAALAMTDPVRVAYSILGALVMNGVLSINHRPDRYRAA